MSTKKLNDKDIMNLLIDTAIAMVQLARTVYCQEVEVYQLLEG